MTEAPFATSPAILDQLHKTRGWVLLLALAGFLAAAFLAIMPLAALLSLGAFGWREILFVSMPTALYLPLILVPAGILYRYSIAISEAESEPLAIERVLRLQRLFFMSLGIILLLTLVAAAAGFASTFVFL